MKLLDSLISTTRLQLLERPLDVEIIGGEARIDVDWKVADASRIDALTEAGIQYNDGRKQFARQMLSEGSVCVIGYVDGEAAHIGWMSFDRIFSPPFSISLGAGWVTFHRTRTAPRFRGLGLQRAGIRKRLELASERGYMRAVNAVSTENLISQHNYHKMGFEDQEIVRAVKAVGRWVTQSVPDEAIVRLGSPAERNDRIAA